MSSIQNFRRNACARRSLYMFCFCLHYGLWVLASTQTIQSGPQVQKNVIFLHSVISLNQLLQNSINNTANICLTFRNHVKIFLSQNIMQNVNSVIYRKNLSIRTDRIDKTETTLIRLLFDLSIMKHIFKQHDPLVCR